MSGYLRVARLYFVMLGIVTVGRWLMGVAGVPYVQGHHVFSIVILTTFAALFYGAFGRRWLGWHSSQAAILGALIGFTSQVVILLAMLLAFALDVETYFNHSIAINVRALGEEAVTISFLQGLKARAAGLVFNTLATSLIALLGWAMGALLPEKE